MERELSCLQADTADTELPSGDPDQSAFLLEFLLGQSAAELLGLMQRQFDVCSTVSLPFSHPAVRGGELQRETEIHPFMCLYISLQKKILGFITFHRVITHGVSFT